MPTFPPSARPPPAASVTRSA